MSDKKQNIEELFKDAFDGFESEVSPDLWSNIQSQMGGATTPASDGGASSSAVSGISSGIVKVAAVVGVTGSLIVGGFWLSESNNTDATTSNKDKEIEMVDENLPEQEVSSKEASNIILDQSPIVEEENSERQSSESDLLENKSNTNKIEKVGLDKTTAKSVTAPSTSEVNHSAQQQVHKKGSNNTPEELTKLPPASPKDDVRKLAEEDNQDKKEEVLLPKASIYASVRKGKLPLLVNFSNNGTPSKNVTWNFGDGAVKSDRSNVYHEFDKPGNYPVILTIQGENGAISRDTALIVVTEDIYMQIPNVITPNYDGINDFFKVEVENIEEFKCVIFNRSGKTIFEMDNIYSHWDGKDMNGNTLNDGTYFYMITAKSNGSDSVTTRKGTIMLKK